jgi:carboxylesterase
MSAVSTHETQANNPASDLTTAPMRCILVHGFNGEPVDMIELERALAQQGFLTTNMLLPGHGTTLQSFAASRWEDWFAAVREETEEALSRGERVILIGHSLGGALIMGVAAVVPQVSGIVPLCPPTAMHEGMRIAVSRLHRYLPYMPSWGEDVRDRWGARRRYERKAYRWVALSTAHSLFGALPELRKLLPGVACPALVVAAHHDHVVPAQDGIDAYKLLGSREKELLLLERSFHVVTKDVERDLVSARVSEFCIKQRDWGRERARGAQV